MKRKGLLAATLAMVLVAVMIPTVAFAANNWASIKQGSNYIVDVVKSSQVVDGIEIQTIERKIIPENRYNPSNPPVPYNSGSGYWDGNGNYVYPNGTTNQNQNASNNNAQVLRNAGLASINALDDYGRNKAPQQWDWIVRSNESCGNSEYRMTCYFKNPNSQNYDYMDITLVCTVTFDGRGGTVVRYYQPGNSTAYKESDIKSMLATRY